MKRLSRTLAMPAANNPAAAQAQAKFQQGLALHQKGQLARAQEIYRQVLKVQPRHFDALHLLGVIAAQTKNFSQAVELIGRATEINPTASMHTATAAQHYKSSSSWMLALASYDRASSGSSLTMRRPTATAAQHTKRSNSWMPRANYDRAIQLEPHHAQAYYNRGNALRESKRLDAALASYDRAIQLKPDYAEVGSNRGSALQELKQLDAAVASLIEPIQLKPDYAEAYSNRGSALQELKQSDAALASYDRAIQLQPDYAEACYNRGNALRELRQLDAALASYDRAIQLQPDYAEAQ